MIEGIRIDLSSNQVKEHLAARKVHHLEKAAKLEANAKDLDLPETSVDNSPLNDFRRRAERHYALAAYFKFLEEHLIADETYRFSEQDLVQLEFIARAYIQ